MDISRLVEDFTNMKLDEIDIYRDLISTKDSKAIFPPYVPLIGKSYRQFRILVYAKAQNISLSDRYLENATTEQRVRRLCDATTYRAVHISPYKSGVIPALVGIYLYAKHNFKLESFDDIQSYLAITNFYKFSLNKNGKDINPDLLKKFLDPQVYREFNGKLCEQELELLRPHTIITFKGWQTKFLRHKGYNIVEISDPSFILHGGRGCFRKGGSYYALAEGVRDRTAIELASFYFQKCEGEFKKKNKIDAIRIYLLKYFNDWIA